MSREGHDDRTTAERMKDRSVSTGFSPSVPAKGHMPFPGHKPRFAPEPSPKPKRKRIRASRAKFPTDAFLKRASEYGLDADLVRSLVNRHGA